MIVEQRIYEIKPGAMHEFLKLYEQEGLSLQSEALGGLAGYFVTEVGDLNCVVQLWRFDSFDERTKRRAALSAMPEWRAFLGKVVSLVVAQRSQLLTPTSFSPIR